LNELVYITGHKNPDTDSICSAIAYAELKRKIGVEAVPVRIGNINKETEFVLNYFGIEFPEYLATVRTQVKDLNMDTISPVSEDISIKTAWNIMKKNNVKVLPVADESGKLLGIITLSEITSSYMDA
jgi:manganese-dependent inorganic pyrophosphatase